MSRQLIQFSLNNMSGYRFCFYFILFKNALLLWGSALFFFGFCYERKTSKRGKGQKSKKMKS